MLMSLELYVLFVNLNGFYDSITKTNIEQDWHINN